MTGSSGLSARCGSKGLPPDVVERIVIASGHEQAYLSLGERWRD
jgi:hypothetical protein